MSLLALRGSEGVSSFSDLCESVWTVCLTAVDNCCGQDLWIIWTLCELKERKCILEAVYFISRLAWRSETCDAVNYFRAMQDVGDCQKWRDCVDFIFLPSHLNKLFTSGGRRGGEKRKENLSIFLVREK